MGLENVGNISQFDSCAQWYAHTCEQFLNLHVDLGLDFGFCAFV